ncbi:MAG: efflux RND transporter periplasmic adaptor subunit [Chitinophagaceae bacterium]|nr:efflux RND transporter periplasmic adaptor subunit [Chitinophagaceae bacterium]
MYRAVVTLLNNTCVALLYSGNTALRSGCIQPGRLVLFAGILLLSCNGPQEEEKKTSPATGAPAAPEYFIAEKGKLSTSVEIPGELIAFQQVDIYAKVSSFVKKLNVDVGSEVKEGQVLATMEAPEINAQLSGAASRLQALEATYTASKAHYDRLLETSKTPGTIPPNDIDIAFAKQKADYAQLQAAKAAEREITDNKNYLVIRAPFSGIITARNVSAGAYVGPSGKGSEQPMFTLQEQKKLRLAVAVPETYTQYLQAKKEISFTIQSLPGEKFSAGIQRMAGALDNRIRSQRIEMDINNTNKKLLPGMIASVSIPLPARDSSVIVPKTAIVTSTEGLFVIQAINGTAKWVEIQKGREQGDQVEIFGNINAGDTLVKRANEEIRNNSVIR